MTREESDEIVSKLDSLFVGLTFDEKNAVLQAYIILVHDRVVAELRETRQQHEA